MSYREEDEEESKGGSLVRKFGLVGAAVLAVIFAKGAGVVLGKSTADRFYEGRQEGLVEAGIAKAAATVRTQVPIKVDNNTTLTGVLANGREIIYLMSLDTDVAEENIPEAQALLQVSVSQNVCGSERTRPLITGGGTMTYQYHLPSGRVFSVSVTSCA